MVVRVESGGRFEGFSYSNLGPQTIAKLFESSLRLGLSWARF